MAATAISLIGILPLILAGYLFNSIYYTKKFRLSKADGQRYFFACATTGLVIGALAFSVGYFIKTHFVEGHKSDEILVRTVVYVHHAIPFPYGVTYVFALAMAYIMGHLGNGYLWVRKKYKARDDERRVSVWCYWRCMPEYITGLDVLLRRAISSDSLILLCLKSRKVYCGTISEVRGDHESSAAYLQIIPFFSITRDKDSLQFDWKTKTEYKAYSLKKALERQRSIKSALESAKALAKDVQKLVSESLGNLSFDFSAPVEELEQEQTLLEQELNILEGADIDLSEWVKVIPITELESISLYKDEDYAKWFGLMAEANPSGSDKLVEEGDN
ncbi:MAG: hypothetical protein ACTHNM_08535 [Dyella sp.]|uniref:hypothetical protein n=1 Tax=Dyella sp. TaxID=1869338 RepID=UPI003F802154